MRKPLGMRLVGPHPADVAREHYLAAVRTSLRTEVHNPVGRPHNLLVVLHHDDGVSYLGEAPQHADEPLRVAAVEPDAWLVEDVE